MAEKNNRSFKIPSARSDLPLGMVFGVLFSAGLFVLMAVAPLVGGVEPPKNDLAPQVVAFNPPDMEDFEEPEPEEPPEEEPEVELEEPPPDLSLEQLDLALNPGMGGNLAGDFALPTVDAGSGNLGTDDFIDFSELDEAPSLIDKTPFSYPRKLRSRSASGRVLVYLELDANGNVTKAEVADSNLPKFDPYVIQQIRKRKFSPPTYRGKPVRASATLPIKIDIR